MQTTNYNLPMYGDGDAPDLTGAYNSAMGAIDQAMKANETAAGTANTNATNAQSSVNALEARVAKLEAATDGKFNPSPEDKVLTTAQLAGAKVTADGIIYFKL